MNPRKLATKIAKESTGVSIRHGKTNGQPVFHLVRKRNDEKEVEAESQTIPATEAAWSMHDWNKVNGPRSPRPLDGLAEVIANKDAQ